MKVLVVGSGGREHALVWKIAQSPEVDVVWAAPGSAAIAGLAVCHPEVNAGDLDGVVKLAREGDVGLVVVGPEDPLAAGLSDRLRAEGISVFGPSASAAQLEGSKEFAKNFMVRHGIPTAAYRTFSNLEEALDYVRSRGDRMVVKADGLAAGKGVSMCETPDQAEQALREMMSDLRFGAAGSRVVIEDWLVGEEASYYAISDGRRFVTLAAAQDHKRALDGDLGENTGGMGACSPAPVVDEAVEQRVLERIVRPVIEGMAADGHPYVGVLYVGLMIDQQGEPHVVEFNVRFGDPETQPLMMRMDGDLVPLLAAAAEGRLESDIEIDWTDAAVCVVMASEGYPRTYAKGKGIRGLEEAEADPDVVVFHAGTCAAPADAGFATAGGRVLGVTARGKTIQSARDRAYTAVQRIEFEGAQFRNDIASRAQARV